MRSNALFVLLLSSFAGLVPVSVRAQQIGYIEKFALAADRSVALQELIPGSEEYFYYNCLHLQNTGKLAESEALLQQWAAKLPLNALYQRMQTRQRLLNYKNDPNQTLEYLRNEMGLQLDHAPPQADRAKDLATSLDPALLDHKKLLEAAINGDLSLAGVSNLGLLELIKRDWGMDQVRLLLQRITRVDLDGLVSLIEKELRSQDSRGWNAFPIHSQLTLEQRHALAKSLPQLLENDVFVRQYLSRLLPNDDTPASDVSARRQHLDRLEAFGETLPPSQNSLKALVLFQRLQLDADHDTFDRARFERYLSLPRNQGYYSRDYLKSQVRVPLVEFQSNYSGETRLPPIMDDAAMVRRYLEHFFKTEESVDKFAKWLDRDYLQNVFVETKILYGIGPSSNWYSKLGTQQQKELRERIELRFASSAQEYYRPDDQVQLTVDVKNVSKLIVRIYQINPRNVYRRQGRPVSTDIDLDGLVANAEETVSYDIPADRRHRESIPLPQCQGRGAWVIDLLGGGLRSRALIVKGQLRSTQRLTDAGHEFRIYDENGKPVPTATIELGTRTFLAEKDGSILIPYAEQDTTTPILLVDGQSATVEMFNHRREAYSLTLGALLESQNLLSGAKGSVIIRTALVCNGQPMPIENLEDAQLVIVTTDMDGTQSTQTVKLTELKQIRESTHQFLVPQRLRTVTVTVTGKVLAVSRRVKEAVSDTRTLQVNDTAVTPQIADFYLIRDAEGYLLQVRGRNGEPISRLPVGFQLSMDHVNTPVYATLATDAVGQIQLGKLDEVHTMQVSAEGLTGRSFALRMDLASWPDKLNLAEGQSYQLPWSNSAVNSPATAWSLLESRSGSVVADWNSKVSLSKGRLEIAPLNPGVYFLTDHLSGRVTEIRVAQGSKQDGFVIGGSQSIELSPNSAASVIASEVKDGKLRMQIAGADAGTRVHLVASAFVSDSHLSSALNAPLIPVFRQGYASTPSFYVDSLKLDEEYQYILQRQYATKYPGNLLAQPSLLLNPWDTATTQNARQDAQAGDMPPPSAAAPMDAAELSKQMAARTAAPVAGRSTYEFLANSAVLMANRRPDESGWIELPIDSLSGYHIVTVVVVQPQGIATKTIALPSTKIPVGDLRLAKSFDEDKHLSQQQQVKIVDANAKTDLGDARTTRVQVYSSLADVFNLYLTLAPATELQKFQKLASWSKLSDDEKRAVYNELACHELHAFLYMKDRPFFDKVVRPYLANKLAPQLVDSYLLNGTVDKYGDLWQRGRLNTFERILLAERIAASKPGIRKWIADAVTANPISPEIRSQRFLAALSGSALDLGRAENAVALDFFFGNVNGQLSERGGVGMPGGGGMGGGMGGMGGAKLDDGESNRWMAHEDRDKASLGLEMLEEKAKDEVAFGDDSTAESLDRKSGLMRSKRNALGRKQMLFQSLDATREWAETQYHRVLIGQQGLALVPPGPMWKQLSEQDSIAGFLSSEVHLSGNTLTEAILALAVLDLPIDAPQTQLVVEEGRLILNTPNRCVVFVETIEEAKPSDGGTTVMVGQDTYLVAPGAEVDPQKPVSNQALVRGIGYRSSVVVTNPSGVAKTISVLTQIPQGSLPLEGGKIVQSRTLRLEPYTTQQVQFSYYFPKAGDFTAYGAQATIDNVHAADAKFAKLSVLDKPESVDQETWGYVALWGTNEQVLEFLRTRNTQQLSLELSAFRLHDKAFFDSCLKELDSQGVYNATLWAYAVRHNDTNRIAQFLANDANMVSRMGPILQSPLTKIDSAERYDYEHLDYRPLVNARNHQLGAQRMILNERLAAQYNRLLQRIAYQPSSTPVDHMALTYYMLLQNRIDEALAHFDSVDSKSLPNQLQYDYFDAYLDFYRGRYDRAAKIADKYAAYEVPRWRDLFAQIRLQVGQYSAMVNGTEPPTSDATVSHVTDPIQRMLLDARGSQQATLASDSPAIDLKMTDGKLVLTHQNIKGVEIRYYLMDIELLFSRNPFVQQDGGSLVAIQPNQKEQIELADQRGSRVIELPKELANRNLLVEVTSGAITQSQVVYANSMNVTLVDSFGRLQVTTGNGQPVDKAYVKVYARSQDGQVRFYKDGYTDLRGQFDYASLSTNDLDTVQRFAILVLHPDRGALIREAAPPKR